MAKFIEYTNPQDKEVQILEVVANKGIRWQVKDDDGSLFTVSKKHVTRGPWEEDEEDEAAPPAKPLFAATLSQLAAAVQNPPAPARKKHEAAPSDGNVVTLKELCFELGAVPRIARRVLRKSQGNVGTGSRWEWSLGSEELDLVKSILTKTAK